MDWLNIPNTHCFHFWSNSMRPLICFCLCFLVCSGLAGANATPHGSSRPDIRKLLQRCDIPSSNSSLGKLFSIGDERIEELITALHDPDMEVSGNAQRVIRYLGNARGIEALREDCDNGDCFTTQPIPIPLDEWDYKRLAADLPHFSFQWEYIIATTLDGSPRALQYRDRILAKLGKNAPSLPFEHLRDLPQKGRTPEGAVAKDLCFVWKDARKATTTSFIAYNGAKDKALVEVYVNQGALMEEWYHVVLQKRDGGWKYFSITMVAQS